MKLQLVYKEMINLKLRYGFLGSGSDSIIPRFFKSNNFSHEFKRILEYFKNRLKNRLEKFSGTTQINNNTFLLKIRNNSTQYKITISHKHHKYFICTMEKGSIYSDEGYCSFSDEFSDEFPNGIGSPGWHVPHPFEEYISNSERYSCLIANLKKCEYYIQHYRDLNYDEYFLFPEFYGDFVEEQLMNEENELYLLTKVKRKQAMKILIKAKNIINTILIDEDKRDSFIDQLIQTP